jgi:nitroimidazol reductase NimA-like FMN-containing flavoprotein (pyridoxamine 5'-phosphate oxidase superfamily)
MAPQKQAVARGLEELTREECIKLLRTQPVGRFAVAQGEAPPHVVPVNYILDGENVVFRSGPGTKLALVAGGVVSFQVDSIDPVRREGWSVLIGGRAYQAFAHEIDHLQLESYAGGEKERWVRIEPDVVTGRRIRPQEFTTDSRGYL